ncbi:MAG: hypothetical protein R3240_00790 [Gammaproteobacteria bacterium]|nr:hypothetical protein [Gammaproteobacteria bacterium]
MDNVKEYFEKYWGWLALAVWVGGAVVLSLVRTSPFAIDEEAAKGLLLTWTVADNVVNPIVIFGIPDFRALLYIPIGAYWPGNLLAAKIMALIVAFIAVTMLYHWAKKNSDKEQALLASGLFLISPTLISQVDSLSAGPYILLGFVLGGWINTAYRKNPRPYGGWYFSQLLWVAILTTLHPIALAYPIALVWHWFRNPHDSKGSKHVYVGIAIAVFLALALTGGWGNLKFFGNPIEQLAISLQGSIIWSQADILWWPGIIAAGLLAIITAIDVKNVKQDFVSLAIYLSLFLGLIMPDQNWALICVALLIYRGLHYLFRMNSARHKNGLLGQRGLVIAASLIVCTHFMLQDKNHVLTIKHALLDPQDELIQSVVAEASDHTKPFRAASQWPARTMLAAKRDVLPLPPVYDDPEKMLKVIKSVTHIVFDHTAPENKALVDALGNISTETETLGLFKGGVLVKVRNPDVELSTQQRLAQDDKDKKKQETKDSTKNEEEKQ